MNFNSSAHIKQFVLYGFIGSCSAALDFLVYTCLTQFLWVNYLLANCVSVFAGIITSFYLNRQYNFKVKDRTAKRFASFLSVGIGGLVISNALLYVLIEIANAGQLMSKMVSIIVVAIVQFLLNKFITFKPSNG